MIKETELFDFIEQDKIDEFKKRVKEFYLSNPTQSSIKTLKTKLDNFLLKYKENPEQIQRLNEFFEKVGKYLDQEIPNWFIKYKEIKK